jgi:F420-dependent oxidoreductase-like protein
MRISISATNYSWPGGPAELAARLGDVAQAADDTGLDTLWVADHLLQADPSSTPTEPMLEAYLTLGFLAARTRRVRLGAMVSAVTFRAPSLLVKAVTSLDVLSGGRAWLGLGAGYEADEAAAMGLPLPPTRERFALLEEVLELAGQMWRGNAAPFRGQHLRLDGPVSSPLPVTQPRPPILIGGMGEKHTLRIVARYADACNLFDIPDGGATIRHKLDVLREHCAAAGRDIGGLDLTVSTALAPGESADSFTGRCAALRDLGLTHVVVITRGQPWTPETVGVVAAARAA